MAVTLEDLNRLRDEIVSYRAEKGAKVADYSYAPSPEGGGDCHFDVHAFELSLLNCFGLNILYSVHSYLYCLVTSFKALSLLSMLLQYLELPFFRLKHHSLQLQLRKTAEDIQGSHQRLLTSIAELKYDEFEQKYR